MKTNHEIKKETGENDVGVLKPSGQKRKVCGRPSFLYPLIYPSLHQFCVVTMLRNAKRSARGADQNTRRVRREQDLKLNWSFAIGRVEQ